MYHIERTKNRNSRALFRGDTIVIRLARNLRKSEEKLHIETLLRRMTKLHARLAKTPAIDPFRPLLSGGSSLMIDLAGDQSIHFSIEPGERTRAYAMQNGWRIKKSVRLSEKTFHRFLWKLLSVSQKEWMTKLVHEVNARTFHAPIRSVGLRLTSSRWGSCSSHGSINLSSALLFLPLPLIEYVIVHEIAHMFHRNHSKRFWRAVESILPEYRERLKELKTHRLPAI